MRKVLLTLAGILMAFDAFSATYTVTNISETIGTFNRDARINAAGIIAWVSYDQNTDITTIIYYDSAAGTVETITPIIYSNGNPGSLRINIQGDLAWIASDGVQDQVYYYNRQTKTVVQLTNSSGNKSYLDIGDAGEAVWTGSEGYYGGIFHYSESRGSVVQLTNSDKVETHAAINIHGDIVWEKNGVGIGTQEIFLYSAASGTISQISPDDGFSKIEPRINDQGDVIWSSQQGGQLEYYDAATASVTVIPSSGGLNYYNSDHRLNNAGDVAWSQNPALFESTEVFLYSKQTGQTLRLTNTTQLESSPGLNNAGDVAWSDANGDFYIYQAATQSTDVVYSTTFTAGTVQISDTGDMVWDDQNNISLATKNPPVAQCEIQQLPANTYPAALNNNGDVLLRVSGGGQIWNNGDITDVSNNGSPLYMKDINDSGQVLATYHVNGVDSSYIWDKGIVTSIGDPGASTYAAKINNQGQVTGQYTVNYTTYAMLWDNGVLTTLGTGQGTDINNLGQVSGNFNGVSGKWDNGVVTPFGTSASFPLIYTPSAINDKAQMVAWGFSYSSGYHMNIILSDNGVLTDLGSLNYLYTIPISINNDGTVVGEAWGDGRYHLVVVKDGVLSELADFLPENSGWNTLERPVGINDEGQVVGSGTKTDGSRGYFLMSGCL
jgi:hypothetical protein